MTSDFLLILVLALSVYSDLRWQKIYNVVTLPALLIALVINSWNLGWAGLWFSGQGLLLGIALFSLPFIMGGLGAGDVKLLAAVGAFKGPQFVFYAFLLTAILGGIISLIVLSYQGKLNPTLRRLGQGIKLLVYSKFTLWSFGQLTEKPEDSSSFPYGFAIVLGSIATYWVM